MHIAMRIAKRFSFAALSSHGNRPLRRRWSFQGRQFPASSNICISETQLSSMDHNAGISPQFTGQIDDAQWANRDPAIAILQQNERLIAELVLLKGQLLQQQIQIEQLGRTVVELENRRVAAENKVRDLRERCWCGDFPTPNAVIVPATMLSGVLLRILDRRKGPNWLNQED